MCKLQPTEKQARERLQELERMLSLERRKSVPESFEWEDDGTFWLWLKGSRHWSKISPIVSDITKRCHDCNKVLVYRLNNLVRYECRYNRTEKEHMIGYNFSSYINLCVGCSNRRWPATKALIEWNETRLTCDRVTRTIVKLRKEQTNEQHQDDR